MNASSKTDKLPAYSTLFAYKEKPVYMLELMEHEGYSTTPACFMPSMERSLEQFEEAVVFVWLGDEKILPVKGSQAHLKIEDYPWILPTHLEQ